MDTEELIQLLQEFQKCHGEMAVLIDDGAASLAIVENVRLSIQGGQSVVLIDLI